MTDLDKLKSVAEWARLDKVNYATAIKRRMQAGVGVQVPPGTWLVTRKEWEQVLKTPLPGCTRVRVRR